MSKGQDEKQKKKILLTRAFTSELKSGQSVRTTFRLSKRCIQAISILVNQMGIKQKSLFWSHGWGYGQFEIYCLWNKTNKGSEA